MNDNQHIDFEGLARFINGEVSGEEQQRWISWIQESDDNKKTYEQALKLLEPDPVVSEGQPSIPFDSRAAWTKVSRRILEDEKVIRPFPWMRYAAVISILAMLLSYWVFNQYFADITYSQSAGIATYILPDSSRVILNGKARITFDRDFNGTNRHIALDGQGYFDVSRDSTLQFQVETPRGLVEVLGTAFLVHETTDSMVVVVDRGLVEVSLKDNSGYARLEKNQAAVIRFTEASLREYELDNTNSLYWANKRLSYRQVNLSVVLNDLSEIFDIPISYNPAEISNCRITAVFLNQSLEEILENISLSLPVEYTIYNDRVEINSNGCPTF
ncbi:FecR family protein [Fulvivirga sedimenti]|uniref:FecR domain-containing protein n=1 Tax=Fulvivirga sedimenti TaxID=2879465 RepID=A0A9X1L2E9_9BACT|nr:FecR domain-containing protein [Fulvivirga sedimenti]MCA6079217.1 FecR domain-containing protein [Fulvivirga sedimenti]